MFDVRAMPAPVPPCPWKANTSGAGRDESSGTTMTAVRMVPPTSKEASWRPGAYARSDVDVVVGTPDGEDFDSADVPPDEHPAASAPMTVTIAIAALQRPRLMPSLSTFTCADLMTPV